MSRTAGPKPAHDPMFSADVRRAFCSRLREFGLNYGTLADELGRLDLPRPSAGSGTWRALIVATARVSSGDALRCAETAARLYDARRHKSAPPPADDDGYLAALTDAPALCAAPGRAPDITICDGVRVFWPVVACRWPVIGESGVCCAADEVDV